MKTIIIGAGRGRRLDHLTEKQPKPFTEIGGKRILDWVLTAHNQPQIAERYFIGGYLLDVVKSGYPNLQFRHNDKWAENNILQSLFYAKDAFHGGFICSYGDILYTPHIVADLLESTANITVAIDTDWRNRYRYRSQHPTTDAEKVMASGTHITRMDRTIPDDQAFGEFIGVAKFSAKAAELIQEHYDNLDEDFCFGGTIPMHKAYLIHFLDYLLQQNVTIDFVATHGHYIEVDTLEDYAYAQKNWPPTSLIPPLIGEGEGGV